MRRRSVIQCKRPDFQDPGSVFSAPAPNATSAQLAPTITFAAPTVADIAEATTPPAELPSGTGHNFEQIQAFATDDTSADVRLPIPNSTPAYDAYFPTLPTSQTMIAAQAAPSPAPFILQAARVPDTTDR